MIVGGATRRGDHLAVGAVDTEHGRAKVQVHARLLVKICLTQRQRLGIPATEVLGQVHPVIGPLALFAEHMDVIPRQGAQLHQSLNAVVTDHTVTHHHQCLAVGCRDLTLHKLSPLAANRYRQSRAKGVPETRAIGRCRAIPRCRAAPRALAAVSGTAARTRSPEGLTHERASRRDPGSALVRTGSAAVPGLRCLGYSACRVTSSKDRALPILFLLGFIKVCKRVWGIDLAGLAVPVRAPRVS